MHEYDVAEALIFLINNFNSPEVINAGTGYNLTIKELTQKIAELYGYTGSIHWDTSKPNGTLRKCLDRSKITAMGFQPKISIDGGIKEKISNYKQFKIS